MQNSGSSNDGVKAVGARNQPLEEVVALPLRKRTTFPYFPFYPTDFIGSSRVQRQTMAERGVYVTLLCYAWNDVGLPTDLATVARMVQMKPAAFVRLWNESPLHECFEQRGERLVNPRQEDLRAVVAKQYAAAAANGRKGGRPKTDGLVSKKTGGLSRNKPTAKQSEPELKPEEEKTGANAPALVAFWNAGTTSPLPRCQGLTLKRTKHIGVRLSERPLEDWPALIARVERSKFCRGQNDRGWVASFDWLISSADVPLKVLEGKYDDRGPAVPADGPSPEAVRNKERYRDLQVKFS